MIKNNDNWSDVDSTAIADYCIANAISAAMTLESRELFNEFARTVLKSYPADGLVNIIGFHEC